MNEEVRRIMTLDPITVSPNQTLAQVQEVMIDNKVQQIPVVENGKLRGLITSYDLWKNHKDASFNPETLVQEVMTTNVLRITPIDKVGTAAELFMSKRFKTLPVVNLDGDLKGVVTAFDVIKHTLKEEYPRPILYREVLEG